MRRISRKEAGHGQPVDQGRVVKICERREGNLANMKRGKAIHAVIEDKGLLSAQKTLKYYLMF